MITQKNIAAHLGISQSAVACALHPKLHKFVSPQKREHILNVAREMGYVPHTAGRRLARTRSSGSQSISLDQAGLIYLADVGQEIDRIALTMMSGAERELSGFHALLNFIRVSGSEDWDKVERLSRSSSVDGWLLVGQADDVVADRLKSFGQPFVILGDSYCNKPVPRVDVDNFAVGHMAAQHFAALGHRRVAYLASHVGLAYQRLTREGFRAGVREFGLEENDQLFGYAATWDRHDWVAVLEWLWKIDPVPTAIFSPEIGGTVELNTMAHSRRVKVPQEISVLGCDLAAPMRTHQHITRIELPVHEMGRRGALLLHGLVTGSPPENIDIKLAPMFVEEGTTASPQASTNVDRETITPNPLPRVTVTNTADGSLTL